MIVSIDLFGFSEKINGIELVELTLYYKATAMHGKSVCEYELHVTTGITWN